MIDVADIVADPDLQAPQSFVIQRSVLQYVSGGVLSTTTPISAWGPVQQASNREIAMLPEGDRLGSVRSFWATQPIYLTRSSGLAPSLHGEVPAGAAPGTVYTLSGPPPGGAVSFYRNGLLLLPQQDYVLLGSQLTLAYSTGADDELWVQWPITAMVESALSDVLVYENTQFRVMQVYRVPGSGYWKALATRMNAS